MGHIYDFGTGFTTDESVYPMDTNERPFAVYLDGRLVVDPVRRAESGVGGRVELYCRSGGVFLMDGDRPKVRELYGEVRVEGGE